MKDNLTAQQQKLLEMLISGIPPKEIAYNLNITYNTILYHQKQLYRKLGVHSLHELIIKYAPNAKSENAIIGAPESGVAVQESMTGGWLDKRFDGIEARKKTLSLKWRVIFGILFFAVVLLLILFFLRKPNDEGYPAVFNYWSSFTDKAGSTINITATPHDLINGKRFTSYTMSGVLDGVPEEKWSHAGMPLFPVPLTLQAMRRMTSFSFKVLGDGNSYKINIPTTDTLLYDENMDHYCITFPTANGRISTVTINVDDLMQGGHGIPVPFIPNNIKYIEFLAQSSEPHYSYHLKIWDIRIF